MRVQKRRSFSSIESQVHWQDCIGRRAEAEATCLCMCRRGGPSLQLRGQVHWQDCIGRRAEAEATCLCMRRRGVPSLQLRDQAHDVSQYSVRYEYLPWARPAKARR